MSMRKKQQAKPALVQIPPLPASEQRKRELLTVYDAVLKTFDLTSFKEKYGENPVAMATMHRVMSPEFLRIANEITKEQKGWKEHYGKVYEDEMQKLHYLPHFVPLALRKVKNLHSSDLCPFEPRIASSVSVKLFLPN